MKTKDGNSGACIHRPMLYQLSYAHHSFVINILRCFLLPRNLVALVKNGHFMTNRTGSLPCVVFL